MTPIALSPAGLVLRVVDFAKRHALPVVFLVSLAACALHAVRNGLPNPGTHDEFAYLLGADTLLEGRLANSPHPLKHYFQTFHVFDDPTYSSKYPMGPSAVLALGELIWHPVLGVWLTISAFCASLAWLARSFFTRGWSLAIGLAGVVQFSGDHYWAQSYWGGSLPALGGALLLGSVVRWMRSPGWRAALPGAAGIVLLVHSRPFEGAMLGGLLALFVLGTAWRHRAAPALLPGLAMYAAGVLLALGAQVLINKAATGDYLKLPYSVYRETRDNNPLFLWNIRQAPVRFEHERLELYDYKEAAQLTTLRNPVIHTWADRVLSILVQYGSWAILPVVGLAFLLGIHRRKFFLLLIGSMIASAWLAMFSLPHYQAPFAAALSLFFALCARRVLAVRVKLSRARTSGAWVAAIALIVLALNQVHTTERPEIRSARSTRASLDRHLQRLDGGHLVVVKYFKGVNPNVEYVFNGAEIDSQKVVWARWSETRPNTELFEHFKGRRLWLMEVGVNTVAVREFNWNEGDTSPTNLRAPIELEPKR